MLLITLLPGVLLLGALACVAAPQYLPGAVQQAPAASLLIVLALALGLFLAYRSGRTLQQQLHALQAQIDGLLESPPADTRRPPRRDLSGLAAQIGQLARQQQRHSAWQRETGRLLEEAAQQRQLLQVQRIELDLLRQEASQANRARGEFLGNLSHEMRTSLNGILGFGELLQRTRLSAQQRDYLHTLQGSAEHLLAQFNQTLEMVRPESGDRQPQSLPLNLRDLIQHSLTLVAPAAHARQLELVSLVYRDIPEPLLGDPTLLTLAFTSLFSHALPYAGSGSLVVRAMLEDESSDFASLRISLQGADSPQQSAEIAALLQALHQAEPPGTLAGSGAGLPLARQLIAQMGGEVGIRNDPDEGPEYWVELHLAKAPGPASAVPESLCGVRAVMLEAHPLARQSLLHQLVDCGLQVLDCDSQAELVHAVAQAQAGPRPIRLAVLGLAAGDAGSAAWPALLHRLQRLGCCSLLLCPTGEQGLLATALPPSGCHLQAKPASYRRLLPALEQLLACQQPEPLQSQLPQTLAGDAPRVLCVDDNPANLLLVQTLLSEMGARVTGVDNGQAAVQAASSQAFDLIFMDIRRPGMDGCQASAAIRQHEQQLRRPAVPIIALTAHALPNQKRALLQAGMQDLLHKPISAAQLADSVLRWTGRQLQRPAGDTPWQPAAAAQPDALPVLDDSEALRLAGGKPELARDLLDMLLGSLHGDRQVIRQARASGRTEALADQVHRLLGAARYCGVPQLRAACQQCENLLRQGADGAEPALDRLDQAMGALLREAARGLD